jgi:hypothetical protein
MRKQGILNQGVYATQKSSLFDGLILINGGLGRGGFHVQ